MPIKQVARVMGCSRNNVKRALAAAGPPRYQRRVGGGSIVDGVEPRIRELLQAWPTMPATVIAERIGWTRGLTVLKDRVRELRPVYLPPDPASRTAYAAGEVAQCDLWFPDITLPVGFGQTRTATRLPVLVMVSGYARWLSARLLPSRAAEDLFAGWWQLLQGLGGVPRVLVWDGEGAVGQRRRRQTVLTEAAHAFRGVLGAKVLICDPGDPEAKGLVERANGYLETSFLPGRSFASPADFNAQLHDWLALVNQRHRRVLGCAPVDRIEADRAAMLPLPPVAPVTGWHTSLRLPRDHYVRLDSNDYSVHPAAVGRRPWALLGTPSDAQRPRPPGRRGQAASPAGGARRHQRGPRRRGRPAAPADRLRRRLRPGRQPGGGLMATKTASRDLTAELAFLTRALKAPSLREAAGRLAERARAESWTHEEFLAACLQREVAARDAHGGEGRIRAARFPARKSLEEFDFDHARGLKREQVAHLGTLDFVVAKENVVFLGPPGTGKTHLAIGLGIRACQAGHRVLFATASQWVDRLAEAHTSGRLQAELVRLGRYPLVIDEVGYIPFEPEAANLF